MVAAMGLVQKLVPLQSKMRSYAKVLVKDKLRTSLVLLALLFFTTWSFHHASMRFNPTTPPTLFAGSGTAAENLPTAEPSSTSSSPSTSPPEPERATRTKKKKGKKANALTGSPKKQHNGKKSAADDDRKTDPSTSALRSHYEELLNAVEQYGNKTIPVEITTRFQKIEEECRRPHTSLDLTSHLCGLSGIAIFIAAYASVVMEERLSQGGAHYHKSVPMTIAAGLIWILIALEYRIIAPHMLGEVESAFRESFLEFGETFLFLVVAMTYINTMEALDVFQCIKVFLVDRRLTLRQLFWATGVLSFLLSPLADNLTTALLMGAVIRSVGSNSKDENFITLSLINVVVASNAGGAFSPFGDITTLMIWQKGKLGMADFQHIVLPSVVNWLVPAVCISRALPEGQRPPLSSEKSKLSPKALMVILLFFFTIAMTALLHAWLHLPAVLGMMTGLGLLQLFGYVSQRLQMDGATQQNKQGATSGDELAAAPPSHHHHHHHHQQHQHSLFTLLANIDWDTLLFFYGVIVSVGGLGVMGYLGAIARFAYQDLGPKPANILIGGLSALIDNIPVLYAVLVANPTMVRADWMLVTLTAGCGGSILSFGSAAGVGLMGQEPTHYNFHKHLRWSWAIILGYIASILAHFAMNGF